MNTANGLLIYDDGCRFCRESVRVLHWLDWFDTVNPLPLSAAGEYVAQYSLSHDALMASVHLITRGGRVFTGVEAVREFGLGMPLLYPLALMLRLGFMLRLAKRFYRLVSANRYRIHGRQHCGHSECASRRK